MNPMIYSILLKVGMKALQYLYKKRKEHTAEQKKELKTALKEVKLNPIETDWYQKG